MPLSGKNLVRLLERDGWSLRRVKGSHHILDKDGQTVVIPVHGNKALGKGLEAKLLKQVGFKK